jgi:peptidoglycan/LPS O-acetylase OafA/YrhL
MVRLRMNRSSLSERLAARDDNFDVLRLGAAFMVLVSHSFPLSGHHEPGLLGTSDTLGFIGVLVFFSISGFLITQSWLTDPHPGRYAIKRLLRIIPGLVVSLVLTAYVLGPIVTSESVTKYLTSAGPASYVLHNTLMLTNYSLPGVFGRNFSSTVNGSLGTLPVEVKAYILVALIGCAVKSRTAARRSLFGLLSVAAIVVSFKTGVKPFWSLLDLFCLFLGASGLYLVRERIKLNYAAFAVAIAVWLISYRFALGFHAVLMGLSLPYAIVFLGFRGLRWMRPLTRPGDVSYGLYVYAFPVTQTVVHVGVTAPLLIILLASPITYGLAWASWLVVERPSLAQKRRFAQVITKRVDPVATTSV